MTPFILEHTHRFIHSLVRILLLLTSDQPVSLLCSMTPTRQQVHLERTMFMREDRSPMHAPHPHPTPRTSGGDTFDLVSLPCTYLDLPRYYNGFA